MPAMHAYRARPHQLFAIFVTCARYFNRTAGLQIDALGPCHLAEFLGRQQFAVGAVDDVEETILGCVQQGLDGLAAELHVGQHDVHVGVVIPGLAGCGLVVPLVLAGVGIERDDGAQEEIIAAAGAADLLVPGRAVAGADQHLVEFRIVGDAVPHRAAAAMLPPFTVPGLGGHFHGLVLEAVSRVARHHPEAPGLFAGLGIVGRYIAARRAPFGAAVADDDLALEDFQRAGHE